MPAYEHERQAVNTEVMTASKVEAEPVLRHAIAVIAAPLSPCAVVMVP